MTTRPQSPTTFPVRPLGVLAVVTLGAALAIVAVRWDGGGSNSDTGGEQVSTALVPSLAPAEPNIYEMTDSALKAHEVAMEAQFGPINRSTVPYDVVAGALAELNAYESTLPPYDTGFPASAAITGTGFDESVARALAEHDAAFPPYDASPATLGTGGTSTASPLTPEQELADALAQHDASFPPLD